MTRTAWGLGVSVVLVMGACGGTVRTGERADDEGTGGTFTTGSGGRTGAGGRKLMGAGGAIFIGPGGSPLYAGSPSYGGTAPSGGGGEAPGGYRCDPGPSEDPGKDSPPGASCCFGRGLCTFDLGPSPNPWVDGFGHAECDGKNVCLPSYMTGDGGPPPGYAPCTSSAWPRPGQKGRCVPGCFVASKRGANELRKDACTGDDEVCAPCFDGVSGASTGVCDVSANDGTPLLPSDNPLSECGAGDGGPPTGRCISGNAVMTFLPTVMSILAQNDCRAGEMCVPNYRAENPYGCTSACTTTLGQFGAQYAAGACVPRFVVANFQPAGLAILTRGACPGQDDLCAPCLDPLNNGAPTHVCD